jgi:hypothetical protein
VESAEPAKKARPLLHTDMGKKCVTWVIEATAGFQMIRVAAGR